MAWITLEEARGMLKDWLEAERVVMTGQSYKIGSQSLTRADLSMIAERIKFWRAEVEKLEDEEITGRRGCKVFRAVPRDF